MFEESRILWLCSKKWLLIIFRFFVSNSFLLRHRLIQLDILTQLNEQWDSEFLDVGRDF